MGKLIVTEFVTLDGIAQARGGADEDRSVIDSPARHRANQRYAVRSEQPAASAASPTVQPSSITRRHNSSRENGHSLALRCRSTGLLEMRVGSAPPSLRETQLTNVDGIYS
jgi:hypothetical protein